MNIFALTVHIGKITQNGSHQIIMKIILDFSEVKMDRVFNDFCSKKCQICLKTVKRQFDFQTKTSTEKNPNPNKTAKISTNEDGT